MFLQNLKFFAYYAFPKIVLKNLIIYEGLSKSNACLLRMRSTLLIETWIAREIKYLKFCTHCCKLHVKQTSRKPEQKPWTWNHWCESYIRVVHGDLFSNGEGEDGGRNSQRISANIWRELYRCFECAKIEERFWKQLSCITRRWMAQQAANRQFDCWQHLLCAWNSRSRQLFYTRWSCCAYDACRMWMVNRTHNHSQCVALKPHTHIPSEHLSANLVFCWIGSLKIV